MAKKKKSSPISVKIILMLVGALLVGVVLTFALFMYMGKKAQQEQVRLMEREQHMVSLAPKVDELYMNMVQLAQTQDIDAAQEKSQAALEMLDEIMEINQEIIKKTADKPKEIAQNRQEVFVLQRKAIGKLSECIAIEDFERSAAGKQCGNEFEEITIQLQEQLTKFQALTGSN